MRVFRDSMAFERLELLCVLKLESRAQRYETVQNHKAFGEVLEWCRSTKFEATWDSTGHVWLPHLQIDFEVHPPFPKTMH